MDLRGILKKRLLLTKRASDRFSNLRGAVFFVTSAALLILVVDGYFTAFWISLVAGGGLFFWMVGLHQQSESTRRKYVLRLRLLEEDEARLALNWSGMPALALAASEVPDFFRDLDLIGDASLLRLLNQTISEQGLKELAELFGRPTSGEEILERQRSVRELAGKRVLRMKFRLAAGSGTTARLDTRELRRLALEPVHQLGAKHWLWALGGLQFVSLLVFVLGQFLGWPPFYLAGWAAGFLVLRAGEGSFHEPFERALSLEEHLARFEKVVGVLERHRLKPASALSQLLAPFQAAQTPSLLLRRFAQSVSRLSVKGNPALHFILNLFVPWDFYFTLQLERTRKELAALLDVWISALARFDALQSLGGYAESCEGHLCWPEVIQEGPYIEARGLGHPLIRSDRRVCNDLRLDQSRVAILITGSNMSGKSTFLRTVGVNVLLARAGAPVTAESFRFRDLAVRASLRTQDSLQDEVSTFYAEVKRLKQILDAAITSTPEPVLYLIDEIFQGTNNRERLLGSRSYIQALLETRATGLVATHDLELADLEREHAVVHNMHFRETIEGERMLFSYQLKDGPCPSTNALKIMALAGLPITAR